MNATNAIESVNSLLATLSDARRRAVLQYLRGDVDGPARTFDIAEYVANHAVTRGTSADGGRDATRTVAVELHHIHLPKLDDAGLITYDPHDRTARYRSDERVEELLGVLERFE